MEGNAQVAFDPCLQIPSPLGQGFSTSAILRWGDFNSQDSTAPFLQLFLHWSLSEMVIEQTYHLLLGIFPENQM